jgi:hypothetical protein
MNPAHPSYDRHYAGLIAMEVNDSVARAANAAGRLLTDTELAAHLEAAKATIDKKFKPQPVQKPVETGIPRATTTKGNADVDPVVADMFKRWANSNDPTQREAAESWKLRNGIK